MVFIVFILGLIIALTATIIMCSCSLNKYFPALVLFICSLLLSLCIVGFVSVSKPFSQKMLLYYDNKMRTSKEQITQSKNLLEKEYIEKIKMPKYKEKYIYWFENVYGDNSLERCEEFLNQY